MIPLRLEHDGTVRLPEEACAALGWYPGDALELRREGDELRLRRARPDARELSERGTPALVTTALRRQLAAALSAGGIPPEEADRAADRLA